MMGMGFVAKAVPAAAANAALLMVVPYGMSAMMLSQCWRTGLMLAGRSGMVKSVR